MKAVVARLAAPFAQMTRSQRLAVGSVAVMVAAAITALAVTAGGSDPDILGAPTTTPAESSTVGPSTTPSTSLSTTSSTSTSTTAPSSTAVNVATTAPAAPPPTPQPDAAAPPETAPATVPPTVPGGTILDVPAQYPTLQAALDAAGPGTTVRLSVPGQFAGPAVSRRDGAPGAPIVITAVEGARLECGSPQSGEIARCFELGHSYYVFDGFSIEGGSSNLYLVGFEAGSHVHDVKILRSTFRGARAGGTGECIRVKYQAYNVEIAGNDIADCGLGKCCDDSKNGEAVYIGTAPEQLGDKNPSPEPDRTHDVWIHHNVMHPWNECVDIKEASYAILVEHNTCGGQRDPESGAFGSRGGRPGESNTFRFNTVENAVGACVRFGGDEEPEGTGNSFHDNVCRDITGEYGVKQMRNPQGLVCGNRFEGTLPSERLSRDEGVDPTVPC